MNLIISITLHEYENDNFYFFSDYYMEPSGRSLITSPSIGTLNRLERQKIVLWKRPLQTIHYALREVFHLLIEFIT